MASAENLDQRVGAEIVQRALRAPAARIAENAGAEGAVVVGELLKEADATRGYDAAAGEYVDLYAAGIVDPAKVVKTAVTDAQSVAALMMTAEAFVADLPPDPSEAAAGPPGGMGGMGGATARRAPPAPLGYRHPTAGRGASWGIRGTARATRARARGRAPARRAGRRGRRRRRSGRRACGARRPRALPLAQPLPARFGVRGRAPRARGRYLLKARPAAGGGPRAASRARASIPVACRHLRLFAVPRATAGCVAGGTVC